MSTLADRLDAAADYVRSLPADLPDPTVQVPSYADLIDVTWHLSTSREITDQRATAVDVRRAIGGKWDKTGSGDTLWLSSEAEHQGVKVKMTIFVDRDQVCERVVKHETITIPAEPARVAVPEHTEVVETVEWVCDPILTGGPVDESAAVAS